MGYRLMLDVARGTVYSTAVEVINQCLIGKGRAFVANVKNTHFQDGALV